jgi:hypothetical protein
VIEHHGGVLVDVVAADHDVCGPTARRYRIELATRR